MFRQIYVESNLKDIDVAVKNARNTVRGEFLLKERNSIIYKNIIKFTPQVGYNLSIKLRTSVNIKLNTIT